MINCNFKHYYAMKIQTMSGQGWDLHLKTFTGRNRTQAIAAAKAWAQEAGYRIIDAKVYSFDNEEGANWQIRKWEKELKND